MFQGWDSFFQVTGEGAATLTGLLFVVVSLSQARERSVMLRAVSIYLTAHHTPLRRRAHDQRRLRGAPPGHRPAGPCWLASPPSRASATASGPASGCPVETRRRRRRTGRTSGSTGSRPPGSMRPCSARRSPLGRRRAGAVHAMAAVLLALLLLGVRNGWDLITWMAPARTTNQDSPNPEPPNATQ